jgi:hypothetical protein
VGGGGGGADGGPGAAGTDWQVVARGVEDLQVLYTLADGTLSDTAPLVVNGNYATLVREVQVTLQARVMKQRLQGETAGAGATGQFVRASLSSTITPRAVLAALRDAPAGGAVPPWK